MAIKRRPTIAATAAENAFIEGAPDAGKPAASPAPYEKGIAKGNKRQISLTIAPELLRKVDEVAFKTGQARAAVINLAIWQAMEGSIYTSK